MSPKHICADCLIDPYLKNWVENGAEVPTCSYCKGSSTSDEAIAAPVGPLFGTIMDGIALEWTDPGNELPFESREGGYQGDVISKFELIEDRFAEEISDVAEFLEDLCEHIDQMDWCRRHYFSLDEDVALSYSWDRFKEITRHERRYFFTPRLQAASDMEIQPVAIPQTLGDLAEQAALFEFLGPEYSIFRARVHSARRTLGTAGQLGAPPRTKARFSNRMSPAGIALFYGALDRETAVEEVREPGRNFTSRLVTSGAFRPTGQLKVLDLRASQELPSIFDETNGHLRRALTFLGEFAREMAIPIEKDGREHVDYVPTQIVTEFFRDLPDIDGILYPSSRKSGGSCCVLFVKNGECADEGGDEDLTKLVLISGSTESSHLWWGGAFLKWMGPVFDR